MKSYIAVSSTQSPSQANTPSQEVPVIGNGGAGVAIAIIGMLIGKWMPWGEIAKQFAGTRTSKVLQSENRKTQEIEAEIDIDRNLSDTVSQIAKQGLDNSSEVVKDLLQLVGTAITSSATNAQSTQALSRASESNLQATQDLIQATSHNSEALKALKEAIEALPKEAASIIEIYAAEFRVALDHIDARLAQINADLAERDATLEKRISIATTRVIEQTTEAIADMRRDLAALKGRSPD